MVTRTTAKLNGQRNQCPTCGELFTRNSVFAKHRVGKFGVSRRCMTVDEMDAAGMFRGDDNFWRGSRPGVWHYPPREKYQFTYGVDVDWYGLEGIYTFPALEACK